MTPRHQAALAYARAGIPIFPCIVNGKQPATNAGFKAATTDIDTIDAWWKRADFNIGLEPARLGWFVVDIDPRHGGNESWEALTSALHDIPTIRTVITPSGGRHLYFAGRPKINSVSKLGPGLDIRSSGGYVLIPPSAINGVEYRISS